MVPGQAIAQGSEKERTMNKKTTTVAIFIFILIVMFFLFPKSCQQGQGKTVSDNLKAVF
ncbi:hypothetical protein L0337_46190 [candidate division KSB1 bacterium]|nr:hypothetical protein [candidate division KSB1 bacterium]